jgi:hypothetical protein
VLKRETFLSIGMLDISFFLYLTPGPSPWKKERGDYPRNLCSFRQNLTTKLETPYFARLITLLLEEKGKGMRCSKETGDDQFSFFSFSRFNENPA